MHSHPQQAAGLEHRLWPRDKPRMCVTVAMDCGMLGILRQQPLAAGLRPRMRIEVVVICCTLDPLTRQSWLQGCGLHSVPQQLGAASRLQRLRIGSNGAVLCVHAQDLETLSALRQLTFLSIAKVSSAADIHEHSQGCAARESHIAADFGEG